MKGTSGLHGSTSLNSVNLQSLLENKLRAKTDLDGSILYRLTWKERITPLGRAICALRGSAKRIYVSGSISSGWPTPLSADSRGRAGAAISKNSELPNAVQLAGWPTPTVGNGQGSQIPSNASASGRRSDGSKATVALPMIAQLTGWATPAAQEPGGSPEAHLARKQRAKSRGVQMGTEAVTHVALQAQLTGWNTPTAPVNTNGHQAGNNRYVSSVTGPFKDQQFAIRGKLTNDGWMQIGFCVEILPENQAGGPLNPEHSRWLMGLPPEWSSCAPMEMRSTRKQQPRSRKSSKKSAKEYDL